jgi:hypothetical protein
LARNGTALGFPGARSAFNLPHYFSISASLVHVATDNNLSSFRGIAGVIGDEPGIHFLLQNREKLDSGFRPQKNAGGPGMTKGFKLLAALARTRIDQTFTPRVATP